MMLDKPQTVEIVQRLHRFARIPVVAAVVAIIVVSGGCAQTTVSDEAIVYSPDWFACKSRFQCVVVQDSYCNSVAVNTRSAIIYQDWSRQQVELAGERVACMQPDMQSPIPACRQGRCVWPLSITRRPAKDGV